VRRPPDIAVVGSCNLDVVVSGGAIPRPGETVRAERITRSPGGKGLNQAIAARRAGARVSMIGAVGRDDAGAVLVGLLETDGVDCRLLRRVASDTGTAIVTVAPDGENSISIVAGANGTVTGLRADERRAVAAADALLLQFELPLAAVAEAAETARDESTLVLLNPAPVAPLPAGLLELVDVLVMNRQEAVDVAGVPTLERAIAALSSAVDVLVVTLGADGCMWSRAGAAAVHSPAVPVDAVDSTGAGDAFAGYLAASLAAGAALEHAIRRAQTAAAIAVGRTGAARSIPPAAEVDAVRSRAASRRAAGSGG
jgi:ribokinase